jgi:hypothetical protein
MRYQVTPTAEVAKTIDILMKSVEHIENDDLIQVSCIATAIIMQKPSIEMEELIPLVKSVSEFIALNLIDKSKIN